MATMQNVQTSVPVSRSKPQKTHFGKLVQQFHHYDRLHAADKAVLKFLAPKRLLPTPQQRKVLDTATISTHDVNGMLLKTYVWTSMPDSPYVVLGHGFMMSTGSMLGFVRPLLKAGFSVVAWDQPGHGVSDGDSTYVQSWVDAYATITPNFSPLAGVIAFSLGGTTALMAMAEHRWLSSRVPLMVCINSPRQVDTVMSGFLAKHGAPSDLLPLMHDAATIRGWRIPEEEKCVMALGKGLPGTRFLFVQDHNDHVASEAEVKYWMSKVVTAELEMTAGLGHHGILGREKWISRIVAFLDQQSDLQRTYRSRI